MANASEQETKISTSVKNVENGYIVTVMTETKGKNDGPYSYTTKEYIAATAKDAQALLTKFIK